jgi:hypothetical protein
LPQSQVKGGYHQIKSLTAEEVNFIKPSERIIGVIKKTDRLDFELVQGEKERLWRYLIQSYHYLGYCRLVGRHMKYFVYFKDKLVALLGFSDGIYHHHLRDTWLGWDAQVRESKPFSGQ